MKVLKIVLAALLLLCLAHMPYGYYLLIRWVALVVFAYIGYDYYQRKNMPLAFVFFGLAVLFQPVEKVALGRTMWNIVDVVVAIFLVVLMFMERSKKNQNEKKDRHYNPNERYQELRVRNIPFIPEKSEVFYLENEYDKDANEFIRENIDYIRERFSLRGMRFTYLPDMKLYVGKIEMFAKYLDPTFKADKVDMGDAEENGLVIDHGTISIRSNFLLDYMVNPENRHNVRSSFAWFGFDKADPTTNEKIYIFNYIVFDSKEALAHPKEVIDKILPELEFRKSLDSGESFRHALENSPAHSNILLDKSTLPAPHTNTDIADYQFEDLKSLDMETKEILLTVQREIDSLRLKGIGEAIIARFVHPKVEISHMTITNDFRIILDEFNNMEIVMEPIVKAVYIFFLRHPEGIMFKDLPDYRKEMEIIYRCVKAKNNDIDHQMSLPTTPTISPAIETLTDPTKNSINEKCSRIRAAFVRQFDDIIARYYYVSGRKSSKKRIIFPRNEVAWG